MSFEKENYHCPTVSQGASSFELRKSPHPTEAFVLCDIFFWLPTAWARPRPVWLLHCFDWSPFFWFLPKGLSTTRARETLHYLLSKSQGGLYATNLSNIRSESIYNTKFVLHAYSSSTWSFLVLGPRGAPLNRNHQLWDTRGRSLSEAGGFMDHSSSLYQGRRGGKGP